MLFRSYGSPLASPAQSLFISIRNSSSSQPKISGSFPGILPLHLHMETLLFIPRSLPFSIPPSLPRHSTPLLTTPLHRRLSSSPFIDYWHGNFKLASDPARPVAGLERVYFCVVCSGQPASEPVSQPPSPPRDPPPLSPP